MTATRRAVRTMLFTLAILAFGGAFGRGEASFDVAEILRQVEARTRVSSHIRMNQSVTVRAALLFSWKFDSVLEYADGALTATTTGRPSFVPESVPVELASLTQTMYLFDLEILSERDEEGFVVVRGRNPEYNGQGAEEATFWIDPSEWLVKRATGKYSWGTVMLSQEFEAFEGMTLLRRQRATVRPLGHVVEVEYSGYTLVEQRAGAAHPQP